MGAFDSAFDELVELEAAYSDDPLDPGNWTGGVVGKGDLKGTKYGISAATYPTLDIANLTLSGVKPIYFKDWWLAMHCDRMPSALGSAVLAFAVNLGREECAVLLQRALGVVVDEQIGPITLAKAESLDLNYSVSMFVALCAKHYTSLAGFAHDGVGWLRRCALVAMYSGKLLP